MAAGGPLQDLCKKATCSICLEFFKDPVTITECDHNFCRGCLTGSWGESATEASCPQCKGKAQPGGLCPNLRLANVVEIAKKFTCQGGKEALCVKHEEPLELFCKVDEAPICLVCDRSKEHRFHGAIPLEEAFQENKTVIKAERRVCEKHQEPLKLFCKDDGALICLNCDRSKEHNYHEVIPIEEAAQEYKDQVCSYLEILKKERENMLAHKVDAIKESQDVLRKTKEEKEKAVAEFRQLRQFLEQQEKLLLTQMEEVEEEIARRREEHLAELSKELFSLQGLIQEMEEKCQQAASELLQDIGSTLQRYKKFETPEAFPSELRWRIWDFCDQHHFLEGVMKQFKATLISGPPKQKAVDVTLDPDTANSCLILSTDRKSVRCGNKVQNLPYNTERFDRCLIVLGCEGFTSGRHFWDVVGNGYGWSVGVARKSVTRKGRATDVKPEFGFWGVKKIDGNFMEIPKLNIDHMSSLPVLLRFTARKIRVCLNYDKGQVSFFNADTAAHLHTFSGASFNGETVFPFFEVNSNAHFDLSF